MDPRRQTSHLPLHLINRMQFFQAKAVSISHFKRKEYKFNFKPNSFFLL